MELVVIDNNIVKWVGLVVIHDNVRNRLEERTIWEENIWYPNKLDVRNKKKKKITQPSTAIEPLATQNIGK